MEPEQQQPEKHPDVIPTLDDLTISGCKTAETTFRQHREQISQEKSVRIAPAQFRFPFR
jgi:hypothetical protein